MKASEIKAKEKEKSEKLKELRRELEADLEEQLMRETENAKPVVEVQKLDMSEIQDLGKAKQIIEALLFASSKPVTIQELHKVLSARKHGEIRPDGLRLGERGLTPKQIENSVTELKETYDQQARSFQIVDIAGGYEIVTRKEFAPWILKVELQKKARQATQSALETLAILAYKQPITRAEIEDLRGVDVSSVMTTLMERGLIKIVGRKEVPGRPFLYGTTDKFLEHFGLMSLQDLPSIDEIKTIVEKSVRKEELLGQTKLIDMPEQKAVSNDDPEVASQEIDSAIESEPEFPPEDSDEFEETSPEEHLDSAEAAGSEGEENRGS